MSTDKPGVGRPTKMTDETLRKLEEAFALGCSDLEASLYADIAPSTLYAYQETRPEFLERKTQLKERPILQARNSVIQHMKQDGNLALKFLERKNKAEFALRQEVTGKDGEQLEGLVIIKDYGSTSQPVADPST